MPKFDRLKGAAKSIRARTEQAKVASEKAKGAAQSAVSQIRDASKGLVDEVTPASRDGLKAASERAKGAAQLAASQIRDTSKGLVDEVTPASRDGLKAASEKVTSSTLSVRSSARKAAGKVSAASTAAGARVRTGSKEAWDAATASAIELVTTTQGLLASSLTSDLNGLMQSMVKGSATIYDKAMDAEYLATHVGGGNHRLFDGGHTIAGAISAGHNASADDGLIQEALGTVQGLLRGCLKSIGMRKPAQHQPGHCGVDPCFSGLRQLFVVLAQSPVPPQPCERALDDPAAGNDLESVLVRWTPHQLQGPPTNIPGP